MPKKLTKEQIEKATIEANKGRNEAWNILGGGRRLDFMNFWEANKIPFKPNKEKIIRGEKCH